MPAYNYTALTSDGKTTNGVIEAESDKQVRVQLRQQNLIPLTIEVVGTNKVHKGRGVRRGKRIAINDLTLVTRQIATLTAAGLPVEESLQAVAEQNEKPAVKSVIIGVRSRILEGHSLASALSNFPNTFPELYWATVGAGEQTGRLDLVLNRLADYMEQQQHVRQKVQHALVYPSIMLFVAVAIVSFLLAYVVPRIIQVFKTSGQQLPDVTLFLLAISHFIQNYGLYLLLAIIIGIYLFKRLLKKEAFRKKWHLFLLKIPLLGYAIRTINTARFARTFGILFAAGVTVLEAMRVSASLVTNIPIREAITAATARVREGVAIHVALKHTRYFAPMTLHLISSGEASGRLEQMLEKVADTQDQSVLRLIETGLTLFEPMIILIMGAIVLFIVLAILLPIFQLEQLTG